MTRTPEHSPTAESNAELLDYRQLLREADLSEDDFEEEWKLYASVYRSVIWALANEYIALLHQKGGMEMTHSEYQKKNDGEALAMCLEFWDESDERMRFEEFGEFLLHRLNLIPSDLRDRFDMYIGFNYGERGGVRIYKDEVKNISQDEYDKAISGGQPIGYTRQHEKEDQFVERLHDRIEGLLRQ